MDYFLFLVYKIMCTLPLHGEIFKSSATNKLCQVLNFKPGVGQN